MRSPPSDLTTFRLPRWVYVAATVVIVWHFGSVGARVLAAMSGPWPMGEQGAAPVAPPHFASIIANSLPGDYLKAIQLNRDYHFATNRPNGTNYKMKVNLKDEKGDVIGTVTYPEAEGDANFWVRHRQRIMVDFLGSDGMVRTPQNEVIPAPGQPEPTLRYWKGVEGSMTKARLATESVNLIMPRGGSFYTPSDLEMVFLGSYARHLCRTHGANSVEVIRVAQEPIPPAVLFDSSLPPVMFDARTYNYGTFDKNGELSK